MLKKLSWALCVALLMAIVPSAVLADYQDYPEYPDYTAELEIIPIFAVEPVMVSVRIEGLSETLFYDFGILTDAMTIHELFLALDVDLLYGISEDGLLWFSSIFGIEESVEDYLIWLLAINNELVIGDIDQIIFNDGDEIVVFLVNWQYGSYAFFTPSIVEKVAGETVELELNVFIFDEPPFPVAGALLEIVSDSPTDRMFRYTDENGRVELTFAQAGIYLVSASLYNEEGVNLISRPMALLLVGESEHPPLLTLDDLSDEDLEYFIEQLAYDVEQFGLPFEQLIHEHEFYVSGPEKGIWVDRYGGTIWFDGDFIMPELAVFTLDDDTVMLPFRQVIEDLLGGRVVWEADARRVTAEVRGQVVGFSLAGESMPIVVVNDRIYVPAEAIEEFFLRP